MPIITKQIDVPTEDGALSVTIRKLSYFQVRRAKDARLSEVIARGKEMADLRDLAAEARQQAPAEMPIEASYDQAETLHAGIVGWSFIEPPSASNIDDLLGPAEADAIFHEIVVFSERPAAEKKDFGASLPQPSEAPAAAGPES